jgi:eukaryotic-like serine/threonine-protein kinase
MSESGIFKAAVKLPPDRRAAYLDQACGSDADLRGEIESLLHAHDATYGFLDDVPTGPDPTEDYQPVAERPGTVIGPYKLMEQIGEGGFGLVFVAEQQHPIRRKVALKIIKPGMDSRDISARFEAERQALALMDHSNIARVFDAGTTDSGRPYFAMELVKGFPIGDYCDSRRLTTRDRLELFLSVCQAVQHAHSKGIIHRDLKPSNILVAPHDGVPVVKVIDFGIAKAIGQQLTDKTIYTRFAQMIGTPLYMSPEQVELNALDVDIRSDVYSLGVLLYELLTGTTPFDRERLVTASFDEMRRIIKEEEPPKPSTRLSGARDAAKIAGARQTEPVKLAKLVRGELDWIVMKALEKDRGRRYQTAIDFATDVQRYLAGEPVLAAPASHWYRLRKLVRRHRGPVVASGLVLLALVCGIAGTTWGLLRAVEERDAKDAALKAEQKAREDETKAREQAFAALRSMTAEVVERKFAQGAVLTEDDRAFLRGVIAQYDAFAAIKGEDADSRAARSEGRFRVGKMRHRLGEFQEAERDFEQALTVRKQLAADFPSRPDLQHDLSQSHLSRGVLLQSMGRMKEAEQDYDQALTILKQLAANFPFRPEFRQDLAVSHNCRGVLRRYTGQVKEAEQDFEEALTIREQLAAGFPSRPEFRLDLASSHVNRGNMRRETDRVKEAEKDHDQALSICKQLAADFPARPDFRHALTGSHLNRAALLHTTGRLKEAEQDYDQAVSIGKQLAADFPARPDFREVLALSYSNRGELLSAMGRLRQAEQDCSQAVSLWKQLANDFPTRAKYRKDLAHGENNLGRLFARQKRFAEAFAALDAAMARGRELVESNAKYREYTDVLRDSHAYRGWALVRSGQPSRATTDLRRALELLAKEPVPDPEVRFQRSQVLALLAGLGGEKNSGVTPAEAAGFADQAVAALHDAIRAGWGVTDDLKQPDFDALRGRDDFKKLVVEFEGKAK